MPGENGKAVVAVTGHRPERLGGYSEDAQRKVRQFALDALKKRVGKISEIITGMAQGWDMAIAEACVELGIPFTAAVPFDGQEKYWPEAVQKRYHELLNLAKEVVVVSPGQYSSEKMARRNRWMVDRAEVVLAMWDGGKSGTSNAVGYAQSKGVIVANLWPLWMRFFQEAA